MMISLTIPIIITVITVIVVVGATTADFPFTITLIIPIAIE